MASPFDSDLPPGFRLDEEPGATPASDLPAGFKLDPFPGKEGWPDPAKTGLLPDQTSPQLAEPAPIEPPPAAKAPKISARDPASIRYFNPGAMYPGPSARKFGAVGTEIIGGGHKIAVFPDPESGAAAQFDLLDRSYTGMTLRDAIRKWSGGNSSDTYAAFVSRATGLSPDTVLTREMIRDPMIAVPLAKAMARVEAGRDYPIGDDAWMRAHARAFGGVAPMTTASVASAPSQAAPSATPGDSSTLMRAVLGAPAEKRKQIVEDWLYESLGIPKPQRELPPGFTLDDEIPAGFTLDEEQPETPAEPQRATFGQSVARGIDIAQQLGYGAVEAFGELTGLEGVTQWGREGRERNIKEAEAYGPRSRFSDISGIGDFIQWAKETAGEQIPIMLPSLAGSGAGAVAGAPFGPLGMTIGAIIGAFIPSFALGVGEVQSAIKEKDPEAVAPGWAFAGGSAIAALDSILPGKVGTALVKAFGKETAEEIAKRALTKPVKEGWIKRGAKGVAEGMATEGITEALQEAIGEVAASQATGQPIDTAGLAEQMLEAGAAGVLIGGLVGGPSAVIKGRRGPQEPPPTTTKPGEGEKEKQPQPAAAPAVEQPAAQEKAPPPPTEEEKAILRAQGWSDEAIADMDPSERAAHVAEAQAQGVKPAPQQQAPQTLAPDRPSAEPIGDLVAQARDLVNPQKPRRGLYLSRDNLEMLLNNPEWARQLTEVIEGKVVSIDDVDGNGGMLVVPDEQTAAWVNQQLSAGRNIQEVIGELTGAGRGKPADGTAVVQQVTPEGNVTRESLVTEDQVKPTVEEFKAPDRDVRVVTPEEAITRRDEEIAAQTGQPTETAGDGSRQKPVKVQAPQDVERAGERVAEPTEAQAEAGNYRHGHIDFKGFKISIETPKGGIRRGKDWEVVSPATYGYFRGVKARAKDKEHVDVYVGDNVQSDRAFVVDQYDLATGRYDEPKVIVGVDSQEDALAIYDAGFSDGKGPQRRRNRPATEVSLDELRDWLDSGDATKPFSQQKAKVKDARVSDLASDQEALPQSSGAVTPPTFPEIFRALPRDANGDPDVEYLTDVMRRVTGKTSWNDLTDAEKIAVWSEITGEPTPEDEPSAAPVEQPAEPAPAEQPEPAEEPAKPDEVLKIGTGDLFRSRSGRELSPAPKIDTSTEGRLRNSLKRLQRWLLEEAKKEAEYSGNDLERISLKVIDLKNLSQGDLDTINLILFGDPDGPRSSQLIARGEDRPKKTTPAEKPKAGWTEGHRDPNLHMLLDDDGEVLGSAIWDQNRPAKEAWTALDREGRVLGYAGSLAEAKKLVEQSLEKPAEEEKPAEKPSRPGTTLETMPQQDQGKVTRAVERVRGEQPAFDLPEGVTVELSETRLEGDEARRKGGTYKAIARREKPYSVEDGYGNTPEEAMRKAVDRLLGKAARLAGPARTEAAAEPAEAPSRTDATEAPSEIDADPQAFAQLKARLRGEGFKNIVEARKYLKENGFVPENARNKDIDEVIEAVVVLTARDIVREGGTPAEIYGKLVELYHKQPNLSTRTGTSVANQAYSTPVPLAYVASRLAGVATADVVYEPTAGNGALLIEAGPNNDAVYANEIDELRAAALEVMGFNVTKKDATERAHVEQPADSIIMNPPFGAVREGGKSKEWTIDGWTTSQVDHAIALKSLEALTDNGRAVLIVGGIKAESDEERRKGYRGKAKREFYWRLYNNYNVVDHFTVDGDLYSRQGASWPVDVIVIEGKGKSQRPLPAAQLPVIYNSWDSLEEKIPDANRPTQLDQKEAGRARGPAGRPAEPVERPASRDEGSGTETVRGGTDGLLAKPTDDAVPVRGDGDRGQSERVGSDKRDLLAGRPAGAGDTKRADKPADADRVRPRIERQGGQATYVPTSRTPSLNTLTPVNMADSAAAAMKRLQDRIGSVDEFVADRLGYDVNDLPKYFGAEQIDAIAAAIDNIERGTALILGDQTGIGKGRQVAAVLRYAMRKGKIPVLVTEKPDLYGDMWRDMRDIGLHEMLGREPRIFMTNIGSPIPLDEEAMEWKEEADAAREAGEPIPKRRGRFLVGGTAAKQNADMEAIASGKGEYDVVFTTYDQMNTVKGKSTPRRSFLSRIAPDALIVFDESHNAGGAGKSGWKVKYAEPNRAQFARELAMRAWGVMFSSATYAKRPDVMDLYARTDMGMAVDDPEKLPELIAKGGVPMQQVVASMLAEAGQYIRRERSFEGVEYAVEGVPVNLESYRQFSDAIRAVFRFDLKINKIRDKLVQTSLDTSGAATAKDAGTGELGASTTAFASIMHNLVNQMLLSIKAKAVAQRAIQAVKNGEKPVIGLANTNESFVSDFAAQEGINVGDVIDLTFRDMLTRYLQRTLRYTVKHPDGKKTHHFIPFDALPSSLQRMYREALDIINSGEYEDLPVSPIDAIRHELTKAGLSVAEVTGRQTMIDYGESPPRLVARSKREMGPAGKRINISRFNSGKLDVLIINRSGATGVSMHASKTFKDQRRRRMILAQAEPNIDVHLQMLGRVHRTGQVVPPAYSQIAAEIPAEARPTAVLMKKMASLNANTTGARGSVFMADAVDFINEVGDKVVAEIVFEDPELNERLGEPLRLTEQNQIIYDDTAKRVTGRLTLLSPEEQAELLDRITKEYNKEIEQLDALGENPLEAKTLDLQARTLEATEIKPKQGNSPFLDAVRMEKVSVKAQGRAYSPKEVAEKLAEFLNEPKPGDDPVRTLTALVPKGQDWARATYRRFKELSDNFIASEVRDTSPDAREKVRERLENNFRRWMQTLQIAYPGNRIRLSMPSGDISGIVTKVERTKKAKNPVALGSWEVRIAVPDSAREYIFPMSKLFPPGIVKGEDEKGAAIAIDDTSFSDLAEKFEEARREGRETRFIFTGNILAAYDQTMGRGRIVNYTTETGEIRPGILMGREFDPAAFLSSRKVSFQTGEQVAQFLTRAPDAEIQSTDGMVKIRLVYGGLTVTMPAARSTGGRIYTDPVVRRAVGVEFERRGNQMVATGIPPSRTAQIVDAIRAVGITFETRQFQDIAQEIVNASVRNPAVREFAKAVDELKSELGVETRPIDPDKSGRMRALIDTGEDAGRTSGALTLKQQVAQMRRGAKLRVVMDHVAGFSTEANRILEVVRKNEAVDIDALSMPDLQQFFESLNDLSQIVTDRLQKGYQLSDDVQEIGDLISEKLGDVGYALDRIALKADEMRDRLSDLQTDIEQILEERRGPQAEIEEGADEDESTALVPAPPQSLLSQIWEQQPEYPEDASALDVFRAEAVTSLGALKILSQKANDLLALNLRELDDATLDAVMDRAGNLVFELTSVVDWANRMSDMASQKRIEAEDIIADLTEQKLAPALENLEEAQDEVSGRLDDVEERLTDAREIESGLAVEVDGEKIGISRLRRMLEDEENYRVVLDNHIAKAEAGRISVAQGEIEAWRGINRNRAAYIAKLRAALDRFTGEKGGGLRALYDAADDIATGRSMRRALDELGFYSQSLEAARSLKQAKGTPEQMRAQLKAAGVKDAEIAATGLDAFLEGKKSVTRDEIVRHLEENRVRLREVVRSKQAPVSAEEYAREAGYGSVAEAAEVLRMSEEEFIRAVGDLQRGTGDTKWSNYSFDPDNPTYRETVLHLPDRTSEIDQRINELRRRRREISEATDGLKRATPEQHREYDAVVREYMALTAKWVEVDKDQFRSGHFPEPNIIGHLMTSLVQDDKGNTVYLIDQIQSDWGQQIRDRGIRDQGRIEELRERQGEAQLQLAEARARLDEAREPLVRRGEELLQQANEALADRGGVGSLAEARRIVNVPKAIRDQIAALQEELEAVDRGPLGTEVESLESRVRLLDAEIRTAESAAPSHPLVATTDQWVNTTLRRAIRQAVEAEADYIAVPSGKTVLTYNPGDEHGMSEFYDRIVPKNLRNLLSRLDKATPAPQWVEELYGPTVGARGEGFTLFRLTDKVKDIVLRQGQPLFALVGQLRKTDARPQREAPDFFERVKARMMLRQPVDLSKEAEKVFSFLRAEPAPVPGLIRETVAVAIRPRKGHPDEFIVTVRDAEGNEWETVDYGSDLLRTSAIFHFLSDGTPAITFSPFHLIGEFAQRLRGERAHEWTHGLRILGYLPGRVKDAASAWGRLVRHAESLGILQGSLYDHLKRIGHPRAENVRNKAASIFEVYHIAYEGLRDYRERIDQEAVAHMVQQYVHGVLTDQDIAPVKDLIDQITGQRTLDAMREAMVQDDIIAFAAKGDRFYAFAGERARTADLQALERAKEMSRAGWDRTTIWRETGWFYGPDGRWRFEIDDSQLRYRGEALNRYGQAPLGDRITKFAPGLARVVGVSEITRQGLIMHRDLFAAYPELRNIEVSMERLPSGIYGIAEPGRMRLAGPNLRILMHEIQHQVQDIEDFAQGGNKMMFSADQIARERQRIRQEGPRPGWDSIETIPDDDLTIAYKLYQRLAGEVESRAVEKRLLLTPEERRERPPWLDYDVPEYMQIMRFGRGAPQYALGKPARSFIDDIPASERETVRKAIQDAVNIVQRIAGKHVDVRFFDKIRTDDALNERSRKRLEQTNVPKTAGGFYSASVNERGELDGNALIGIAMNDPAYDPLTTAGHEAWHHVEHVLATNAEMRLLRHPSEMERAARMAARGAGVPIEEIKKFPDYEIRAIAFQFYRRQREEGVQPAGIHIAVRRFWDRVIRILRAVRNIVTGRVSVQQAMEGSGSIEAIFERARRGEFAGREPRMSDEARWVFLANVLPDGSSVILPSRVASIRVYHGSPHDFDRFDISKIGTGEGAQSFGWGLYFADRKEIAEWYRDKISKRDGDRSGITINGKRRPQEYPKWAWEILSIIERTEDFIRKNGEEGVIGFLRSEQERMQALLDAGKAWMPHAVRKDIQNIDRLIKAFETGRAKYYRAGRLYEVRINAEPEEFLDWFKPLSQQSERVRAALAPIVEKIRRASVIGARQLGDDPTGEAIYSSFGSPFVREALTGSARGFSDKSGASKVLREAGIKGIRYLDQGSRAAGEGSYNYVVFDDSIIEVVAKDGQPVTQEQRKAVLASTLPTGPAQPQLTAMALIRRAANKAMASVMNHADRARIRLQDRFLMVRRYQEAREKDLGIKLPLNLDVYLAEALYYGRAGERLQELRAKYIEPLKEKMIAAEIKAHELGDYLYARHARERNALIRSIDPDNDLGSGMTDKEAEGILDRIAKSGKQADYAALAKIVDDMIQETRDTLLRAGLIDREQYDSWNKTYNFYVPLRGWEVRDEETSEFPRTGRGFSVRGPEAFKALGRRSKADNPLLYAIQQAEQAIIRAEKNRVDKTLLRLIETYPDPEVWRVYKGEYRRRLNPQTGLVEKYWVPPHFVNRDNIIGVKVGGKQRWIEIKHPGLLRAIRGTGSEIQGSVLGNLLFKAARFYAGLLTSYNPEFLFSNFFRDLETALINVSDIADKPEGLRRQIVRDALSAKAIRGAFKALRGDVSDEYSRWFEEFRLAGGKISFLEYNDIDNIRRDIEKSLSRGRAARAFRQAAKLVEDLNTAVENGVRLSVYKALRENGVPQDRAAFVSRELTVNFNRKGEWGPTVNAAYLFFNASAQGTIRIAQAVARSKAVRWAIGSIFATGLALDLINSIIAGDDDDGENAYDKIPDWVKERNLIIMIPGDPNHGYIQLPLAYGYNVPYLLGQKAMAVMRGADKPFKAAATVASSAFEAFNPIGAATSFAQMISPTFLDPVVQVLENKTWYGAPIYPTHKPEHQPWSETFKTSTPEWAIEVARTLNAVSGGNAARAGLLDFSPDVIVHYSEFLAGGVGKLVLNTIASGERIVSGDEWLPEKTPFIRRLYGRSTTVSRRREFFEAWDEVDAAFYEVKELAKDGDMEGSRRAREEYRAELAVYPVMKTTDKALREMRKQREQIEKNKAFSEAERRQRLDDLRKRENQMIMRALAAYAKAKKEAER